MLFNDCGNFIDEIEFRMKDSRSEKKRENAIKRMKSTIEYTQTNSLIDKQETFKGQKENLNEISQLTNLKLQYEAEMYD